MNKLATKTSLLALAIALCSTSLSPTASAFPTTYYASESVLATGKWVRIDVDRDGVYQLTASELQQMGFNNIGRVKVYGQGGHMLGEVLNGTATDDLKEQPTLLQGDKLCFYGRGPIEMSLVTNSYGTTYYTRTMNAYSTTGSYFITEGDAPLRVTERSWLLNTDCSNYTDSYNWQHHEEELLSTSTCGKDLLGEDILTAPVNVPYTVPNLSRPELTVLTCCAVGSTANTSITASVVTGGQTIALPYSSPLNTVRALTTLAHYYEAMPVGTVALPSLNTSGVVRVNPISGAPSLALLDYVTITYHHTNTLTGEAANQTRIGLADVTMGDTITVSGNAGNVVVWNLDNPEPTQMAKKISGSNALFSVPRTTTSSEFVAFDPTKELLHIANYTPIANQNLHGQPVPDMIILTHHDFRAQAEQLAELHRTHDNADVLVVEEQEAFNEFSSGTRDAMGVRLMCKMFYDRDPIKMKYLLLFGQGTYDNRQLSTTKSGCIITFENSLRSDVKINDWYCYYCSETYSHAADDFFGLLDDGSGQRMSSDKLRLGVGRITSSNVVEAQSDVDKITEYITQPNYGAWRNNVFLAGDQGKIGSNEGDLHIFQAQGIGDIIENDRGLDIALRKCFIPMFPKATDEEYLVNSGGQSCPEANRYMRDALLQGQYFISYVGHAASTTFTGTSRLWVNNDVMNTSYAHPPIMTTACCNVARFDSNIRGIAEHMFHKRDGGAIALLAATREVYSSGNDLLNRAFTRALFQLNDDGSMPTLGQVTMRAKQDASLTGNDNKMNFMVFGDPMMPINFPRPLINVTKVNGTNVVSGEKVNVSPLQQFDIEANVLKQDKTGIDNTFTGDAIVTIFDASRLFRYAVGQQPGTSVTITRRIDYPRTVVTQVDARVVNGKLHATVMLPRDMEASDTTLRITVYAHKAGTDEMASGNFDDLMVTGFNASTAVNDTQSPIIEAMYLGNDADAFDQNPVIGQKSTLHISATDDVALGGITGEMGRSMRLELDHGFASYAEAKNYAVTSDGGKHIDIALPINGLSMGHHTLGFTIYDMAGNTTSKSIEFTVNQTSSLTLAAEQNTVSNEARFDVVQTTLPNIPAVTIKVIDAVGNLVWQRTTSTVPCTWDLKGLNGQRVPSGVYRYWCTYDTDEYYGGSPMGELIVVDN